MPEIPGCWTTSGRISQYASQHAFWHRYAVGNSVYFVRGAAVNTTTQKEKVCYLERNSGVTNKSCIYFQHSIKAEWESAYLFQWGLDSFGLVLTFALFVGHLEDILVLLNPGFVFPHDWPETSAGDNNQHVMILSGLLTDSEPSRFRYNDLYITEPVKHFFLFSTLKHW